MNQDQFNDLCITHGLAPSAPLREFTEAALKQFSATMLVENESCAQLCERMAARYVDLRRGALEMAAENIRARVNK
jgi:hypothetical protein